MIIRRGNSSDRRIGRADRSAQLPAEELLALHDALDQLAAEDTRATGLVKLRYFAGLTLDEAAKALGISSRMAHGVWTYARAQPLVKFDPSI